jgi:integrase/recombinase XerD
MSTTSPLLPFQPMLMTTAQLAVVSFLARYGGHTHDLYSYQLRRWFGWCEGNGQPHLSCLSRWRSVVIRSTPAGSMSAQTADARAGVRFGGRSVKRQQRESVAARRCG